MLEGAVGMDERSCCMCDQSLMTQLTVTLFISSFAFVFSCLACLRPLQDDRICARVCFLYLFAQYTNGESILVPMSVCVRESENVCVVWLRVICTSPWHCHRFLSTVTSCLSRFSLSSSNTHTPTIPSSLYSSLQLCSIYTSIHPSVRTARPQPVSFINHQHWEGTREQSDELEEIEKGGRNDKCKRLEVKDETWTSRKWKSNADIMTMINTLPSFFFSDPILSGSVSALGIFKGMHLSLILFPFATLLLIYFIRVASFPVKIMSRRIPLYSQNSDTFTARSSSAFSCIIVAGQNGTLHPGLMACHDCHQTSLSIYHELWE